MTYCWVDSNPDCAVCLQQCLQPVQLPCKHIFCFLCLKGFAYRSKKCALCRSVIELEYFNNPIIIKVREKEDVSSSTSNKVSVSLSTPSIAYNWFYEGRNGWWQYDERASLILEKAFSNSKKNCEILIAGFLYVVDFERMVQYRKDNLARLRKVKRDSDSADLKGVAGIKLQKEIENKPDSKNVINKKELLTNTSDNELNIQETLATERPFINLASDLSQNSSGVNEVLYGIQQVTLKD
ncbi:E3 ubiquitin-protein ligase rnf146 [Hydra vulgaris]|uniref:E3 ubiquitin-protein ligase n=1 Tax=Hydra vulgaris TaxID=6087 RepID=A0ABM4CVH2_HYDVU